MPIVDELRQLGLKPADTVMVHASMRAVGGRSETLVQALLDLVGPTGTVMAYVDFEATPELPDFVLDRSPAATDYGVLAETVRTWPGAMRSRNPGASMAAIGARARWLTSDHPYDYGYGPGSPLAKLVEADGVVALLGSDLDQVTLLHLAEHLAVLPDKRVVRHRLRIDGTERTIEEFDTSEGIVDGVPERLFARLIDAFIDEERLRPVRVGGARSYLLPAPRLVTWAVRQLELRLGRGS